MRVQNKSFWTGIVVSLLIYAVCEVLIDTGVLNDFAESTLILICINIILGVSLNLINGFTGQFSIGHAGFMSIGAYLSAIMTIDFNMPFVVALVIGGLAAAVAGLIIGIPSLRLKGDYLAIATLGFGEIIRIVWLNTEYVGGASGLSGIPTETNWTWVFLWTLITVVVINNFVNSTHGRACISVRENEIAAEAMGVNTTKYKVMAFVIGAFFAGIAGGLSAHMFYIINPNNYNFMKSFEILVIVVLGGLGSTSGSIVGAIVLTMIFTLLQDYPDIRMIIYSVLLILMMIFRPSGLMGTREFRFNFLNKKEEQHGATNTSA
ncbi:branched-chain amino acid ABC transporter permease [Effusibacillus pohliae]|uniref:branched-chain amino acid ABC transporter permease n=1 Tax=Effusibacillus pohliae TaxID=232270 RepID=UPI00036C1C6A|nr:branched-chain amino acid ABC transporter permease [Effusibacillus pohliae]